MIFGDFFKVIFSGKLKIAEVASRFQNVKNFIAALGKMGFQLKRKVFLKFYFLYFLIFSERNWRWLLHHSDTSKNGQI